MSELETDLRKSLDELARACRILEMEGHGDMTLGHLSFRDPQGRGFWLNRTFNSRSIGISFPGVPELIGPFNNYDARVSASQTLFDWSSVRRVRAAGAQADCD